MAKKVVMPPTTSAETELPRSLILKNESIASLSHRRTAHGPIPLCAPRSHSTRSSTGKAVIPAKTAPPAGAPREKRSRMPDSARRLQRPGEPTAGHPANRNPAAAPTAAQPVNRRQKIIHPPPGAFAALAGRFAPNNRPVNQKHAPARFALWALCETRAMPHPSPCTTPRFGVPSPNEIRSQ